MPRRQKRDVTVIETPVPGGAVAGGGFGPTGITTRFGLGGWVAIEEDRPDGSRERLLLRVAFDQTEERLIIRELHLLDTGKPVTAGRLRAVTVASHEERLNLPEERARIEAGLGEEHPLDVEAVISGFDKVPSPKPPAEEEKAPLRAIATRGYPDAFYERVAAIYHDALRRKAPPVAAIAAEGNVPRSTAARWVKEARRRRYLSPAPGQGKKRG